MDDDSRRFDEDATLVNFGEELEFGELDGDMDVETELLVARVRAARYAGV
ncbi:MAG TPA: hypothetical protein VEU32_03160 [Burkholderiales bacterium]|nr:hypothetical protein [Burkholderiales bacterium]